MLCICGNSKSRPYNFVTANLSYGASIFADAKAHRFTGILNCSFLDGVMIKIRDAAWMAALILLSGALYVATLLPGVGGSGDSGKFQFVGKVLGTPHATGYPLYITLNHVFGRLVAIGSFAYRANLMSAVFATATLVVLYLICRVLNSSPLASFTAAAVFAVGPVFWSQALEAEVYTLHSFLMSLTILFLLKWTNDRADRQSENTTEVSRKGAKPAKFTPLRSWRLGEKPSQEDGNQECGTESPHAGNAGNILRENRYLLAACAVYSLAFGNHMTSVMMLPSFAFIVFATDRRIVFNLRMIAVVLAFITLGILQYTYVFWRYYSPDTPYLEMATPNLKEFFWYIQGAQFHEDMFAFPISKALRQHGPMFMSLVLAQFQALLLFVVWGIVMLARDWRKAVFLLVYSFVNAFWAMNYWIFDIEVYFIPTFLILAVCLAVGLNDVSSRRINFIPAALWCIMLLVPIKMAVANFSTVSERGDTETQARIEKALRDVKSDALIISSDYDYSEYFWYFLIGEGMEKEHNIYLMNDFNARGISEYLNRQGMIYLKEERKYVPPCLKVYCHVPISGPERDSGLYEIRKLKRIGLSVTQKTDELFAVGLPAR